MVSSIRLTVKVPNLNLVTTRVKMAVPNGQISVDGREIEWELHESSGI